MKAFSVRLEEDVGARFDEVCRKAGYKKNTVISRLIEAYVQSESKGSARRSWRRKGRDPFAEAIGLLNLKPLLVSEREIDRIVYNL